MTREFKSVLLIGGSSEIGFGILEELSSRSLESVHVLGRNPMNLEAQFSRLREGRKLATSASKIEVDLETQIRNLFQYNKFDLVLIAVGKMMSQDSLNQNPNLILDANEGNVSIPTIALLSTLNCFEAQGFGHVAVLGSVAGDRGRKINVIYGAGKAYLETVCEGVWQRLSKTEIKLTLVKPGPTDTKMSRSIHVSPIKMSSVQDVSRVIVQGLSRRKRIVYAPQHWRYIMTIIKLLPRWIFVRTNF
jgi:short-subunit dehydrogenase